MKISEKKMQLVINNYFKQECDVNTSIREAFEKGFRIGVKKASSAQPERKKGRWMEQIPNSDSRSRLIYCSECGHAYLVDTSLLLEDWAEGRNFCIRCGSDMRGNDHDEIRHVLDKKEKELTILPSTQQWIPVTERLPENDKDVLITDGEDCEVAYWRTDAQAWDSCVFGWVDKVMEVVAWMPLPKL